MDAEVTDVAVEDSVGVGVTGVDTVEGSLGVTVTGVETEDGSVGV